MTVIIGFGFVGKAVYNAMKDKYNVHIIDPKRGTTTKDEDFQSKLRTNSITGMTINEIIVCVDTPTTESGDVNIDNFTAVWNDIKDFEGLILIKSTIPKKYLPLEDNVVYCPEFLNANSAYEDFLNPGYTLLGGEPDFTYKAEYFFKSKTNVESEYITVTKDEASDFKYLRNIKQAYNLMYWEFVQDVTGNSRKMASLMEKLPMGENSLVGMDGFRGFGGACLPKDIAGFNFHHEHKLTKFLLDYNEDLSTR